MINFINNNRLEVQGESQFAVTEMRAQSHSWPAAHQAIHFSYFCEAEL